MHQTGVTFGVTLKSRKAKAASELRMREVFVFPWGRHSARSAVARSARIRTEFDQPRRERGGPLRDPRNDPQGGAQGSVG